MSLVEGNIKINIKKINMKSEMTHQRNDSQNYKQYQYLMWGHFLYFKTFLYFQIKCMLQLM